MLLAFCFCNHGDGDMGLCPLNEIIFLPADEVSKALEWHMICEHGWFPGQRYTMKFFEDGVLITPLPPKKPESKPTT